MVVKKHILNSLRKLDKLYATALTSPDPQLPSYYSKLATIEYCGWLEDTMDGIVRAYAGNRLKTAAFRTSLNDKINKTHGFGYERHFKAMIVHVVGVIRCERIQMTLDASGDLAVLESELDTYGKHRNEAAHTHLHRVAAFPSPSATMGSLGKVYPILKVVYIMRKDKKYC